MRARKKRRRGRWVGRIKRAIHRGVYHDKALVQSDLVAVRIAQDMAAIALTDSGVPDLEFHPPVGETK